MKRVLFGLIFFVGWVLSPFTWWNDFFVNIPLSHLLANIIFYVTHLPFRWLVIFSYALTNLLGLLFMFYSGKSLIISSKSRVKVALLLIAAVLLYSAIMIYLDQQGRLYPLGEWFKTKNM